MVTGFWLARHGQSAANLAGQCSGQWDVPLTALGRQQASLLAERLAHEPVRSIVSSPLQRACETAAIVAQRLGLSVELEPDFAEIQFGAMQGRFRDARDPEAAAWWEAWRHSDGRTPAPGGERFEQLVARVRPALARWLAPIADSGLLIVGHRNVNRAVIAIVTGEPLALAFHRRVSQNKLVRLELGSPGTFREERFFRTPS